LRFDEARFEWRGARYASYFDYGSTGSVQLTIPAGAGATTEPALLRRFALSDEDEWTTTLVYDPSTTLSAEIPVTFASPGAHYIILRLPTTRRIRWTHFEVLPPAGSSAPSGEITTSTLRERWHKLVLRKGNAFFDEDTTGTWLANDPDSDFHWMREDAYYAVALLDDLSTVSHARANAILRTIAQAQDRTSTSPTYGWFFVNAADLRTPQNASTFFIPPVLAHLCLSPPPTLEPPTLDELRTALWYVTEGVASRFSFPPLYENFYFMGTATLALAARLFDNSAWASAARAKLEYAHSEFLDRGASAEWASPVYTSVSDWALGLIAQYATDPTTRDLAEYIRQRLWFDVALFYAPSPRQPAGPFSRVYEDGLRGGAGLTTFMLAALLGYDGFDSPTRLAEMVAAKHSLDINPAYWISLRARPLLPSLREAFLSPRPLPSFVRQRNFHTEAASYISQAFSLGSVASTTASLIGQEGLVAQIYEQASPTGLAPIFARAGSTASDVFSYSVGTNADMFGFQDHARVIWLSDRTFATSAHPAPQAFVALLADERFQQWEDWRVDGTSVSLPCAVSPSSIITAKREGTYLCAVPLYVVALGSQQRAAAIIPTAGHTALVLFGLDSTVPEPIGGKHLEAGWALALTEAANWPSYDAFVADCLTNTLIELIFDPSSVEIRWDWHGTMEAIFQRSTRQWVSRKINATEVSFPLLDADFAAQTPSGDLSLRDFSAWGLAPFSWAIYPHGTSHALLANPDAAPVLATTLWSPNPTPIAPFGFAEIAHTPPTSVAEWERYADAEEKLTSGPPGATPIAARIPRP
jgi:hypothetical protein